MNTLTATLAHKSKKEGVPFRVRATSTNGSIATIERTWSGFAYNVGHGVYYLHQDDELELRAKLVEAGFSPNDAIWE
jgi:hypothetical protein